jgi:hypothetical protein
VEYPKLGYPDFHMGEVGKEFSNINYWIQAGSRAQSCYTEKSMLIVYNRLGL